jgi:hypothetical protein
MCDKHELPRTQHISSVIVRSNNRDTFCKKIKYSLNDTRVSNIGTISQYALLRVKQSPRPIAPAIARSSRNYVGFAVLGGIQVPGDPLR